MPAGVAAQIRIRTAQVAAVLLAAGAALAPSVAAAVAHAASLRSVVLQHNRFSPRNVVVHRGDTVTWLWRDGKTQHNVVSNSFHGLLNPKSSGSFTKRFTRSGSYSYFCTIHAGMTGTIVVH
jgi:plastocyanin